MSAGTDPAVFSHIITTLLPTLTKSRITQTDLSAHVDDETGAVYVIRRSLEPRSGKVMRPVKMVPA